MQNNCDGSGPHKDGEVRVLPMNPKRLDHGNLILCEYCWDREMRWRKDHNQELAADAAYALPRWAEGKVYEAR